MDVAGMADKLQFTIYLQYKFQFIERTQTGLPGLNSSDIYLENIEKQAIYNLPP